MNFDNGLLTEKEHDSLKKFVRRRDVAALLKDAGQVALVFGPSTGIGVPVYVHAKDWKGNIISEDITDHASW